MADEEQQPHRPYTDALVNQWSFFRLSGLGPVGPNPFGRRLRPPQVLDLLRSWKNGKLPNNHPIKIFSVYSFLPDEILKRYDLSERTPVWFITHLFKMFKLSDNPSRAVLDQYKTHWAPMKQPNPEAIMEDGNPVPIGHDALKLALWAERKDGKCVKTAYRMEEYTLHNDPDPAPIPIPYVAGKPTPSDQHGLYKHGNWMISKMYKRKSKRDFLFSLGSFA